VLCLNECELFVVIAVGLTQDAFGEIEQEADPASI
jgi:hypothetical protein